MPLQIIDTNSISSTPLALGSNDVIILPGVTVGSGMSSAITTTGNNQKVNVQGNVVASNSALELGTVGGTGQHLTIGTNGYIGNSSSLAPAILMLGIGNQIDNAGTVDGEISGIEMRGGINGGKSVINNSGLIEAYNHGIFRADIFSNYEQTIVLNNSGELRVTAINGSAYHSGVHEATDEIFNSGLIFGDVYLGAGADGYNGTTGRIIGTVFGGAGGDLLAGSDFAESFFGDDNDDMMLGGGGDDYLNGGDGMDNIYGGTGNDRILGGDGANYLEGGDGDDSITGGTDFDLINGGAGDDELEGDDGDDALNGGDGNDLIFGYTGFDEISGGLGDDSIDGHDDGDEIRGDAGDDTIDGGDGDDEIDGGIGDDQIEGSTGDDKIYGQAGNDEIEGGNHNDTISGGDGADRIEGEEGNDLIAGDAGNDVMRGNSGNDQLTGGAGDDRLDSGVGADMMNGGAGNDTYVVENLGDLVVESGGSGTDIVFSAVAFNLASVADVQGAVEKLTLLGAGNVNGTGNALANALTGNAGNNVLKAGAGNDTVSGGNGNDQLFGEAGNDVLNGGAGTDNLYGGLGNDTMTGGATPDRFVFDTAPNSLTNRDVVTDFQHGTDRIFLDNAVFAAVGPNGALQAGFFHAGAAAHDANDRIVYNQASGVLSYDADGTGAQAAVQFAVLAGKPVVTASDFVVI